MTDAPTFSLSVCGMRGIPRYCVYLNDHRIAGAKPWGGAEQQTDWSVTLDELCAAIPQLRQMREALQYGFDLYGYDGPDGRWPLERRHEFDRLARLGLGLSIQNAPSRPAARNASPQGPAPGGNP